MSQDEEEGEMKLSVRIDSENERHTRITVFQNGGNAGQLCIESRIACQFLDCLIHYHDRIARIHDLEADRSAAESFIIEWCQEAGWATGHGDTILDILREMKWQQEEGLAKAKKRVR